MPVARVRRIAPEEVTARWLLDGPAQLSEGPHVGAVAGVVDTAGRATYAYPEITGYYLQWLADRAHRLGNVAGLSERATAAARWLERWSEPEAPLTRVPLQEGGVRDWRNGAIFLFDIAMVVRGLGAAAAAGLLAPSDALVQRLDDLLQRLIGDDGRYAACVATDASADLPARWSTRRGGYLAKAAAGIVIAGDGLALTSRSMQAAHATFTGSIDEALDAPHAEAHPLLYAYEGMLALPHVPQVAAGLPLVARIVRDMVHDAAVRGYVAETRDDPEQGPRRVDVMAQALRVARLVQAHGAMPLPDVSELATLVHVLEGAISAEGALPFALGSASAERNTWAAMFVEQALAWSRELPPRALDTPLIV